MCPGDLRTIRDSAVIGVLEVLLLKRSGGLGRHEAGPSRIKHRARHRGPPGNRHVWCGLDFADADLVFDDCPARRAAATACCRVIRRGSAGGECDNFSR